MSELKVNALLKPRSSFKPIINPFTFYQRLLFRFVNNPYIFEFDQQPYRLLYLINHHLQEVL